MNNESFRLALRLLSHPFDALYDIKYYKKGSVKLSIIILIIFWLIILFKIQRTGYIFMQTKPEDLRLIYETGKIFVPFIMWVTSNWMVSTLFDGEGKYSDIWINSAYALLPVIVIYMPLVIISNFMIETEGLFIKEIQIIAMIWSGLLMFFGVKYANNYTMKKNVFTCLLTIFGMVVMIFLAALFITLIQETGSFIYGIVNELYIR